MTAGGDATLAEARRWVGTTEQPPNSNNTPFWDWWGCNLGSWCACFTSYCGAHAGYPLPAIDASCSGVPGYVSCPNGTVYAWGNGEIASYAEPGDHLIFSWYPWELQGGVPVITSGEWAGWVAGDHTGFFVAELGGGYIQTVEGNTSQSSWDNGGAVLERTDRYWGQVCALWRPSNYGTGGGPGPTPPQPQDDDMYQTCLVTTAGDPWNGSVFMVAGGRAVGMSDSNIVANLQARGLAGPTINVEAWDIYGGYEVIFPSGPAGGGRPT
jgi:hypothetical protein